MNDEKVIAGYCVQCGRPYYVAKAKKNGGYFAKPQCCRHKPKRRCPVHGAEFPLNDQCPKCRAERDRFDRGLRDERPR